SNSSACGGVPTSHRGETPPSLWQALKNEEQSYLSTLPLAGTSPLLDVSPPQGTPGGSPQQLPDVASLQMQNSLRNVPLCPQYAGFYGVSATGEELPSLPQS